MDTNTELAVSLPPAAWQIIGNALSQRPYAEVAGLLAEIQKQIDAQIAVDKE